MRSLKEKDDVDDKKHAWELTLLLLLILEILGFGLFNPLMLDLNVLLYSTSDFIYIGMLALPLTMIIISGEWTFLSVQRLAYAP